MGQKILIVDDDTSIASALETYLRNASFEPISTQSASDGLRILYAEHPALVLLDIMMPGMDGWEMAARIRELSDVPLIIISARGTEQDKLRGFRLGADDYITKPFSLAEVGARIEAVLARSSKTVHSTEKRIYNFDDLTVDLDKHRVSRQSKIIDLTPTEFRMLRCLIEKAGDAVSEEYLHQSVWSDKHDIKSGYVRRYIWFLRQKLERDPSHPELIHTVRKFGYRFGLD